MTIIVDEDRVLVLKGSLELERNLMNLSLNEYFKEMKVFEKNHKMKTKEFIEKFNSGQLGDEEKWFDWLFVYKAYQHINNRIKIIDSIVT